jgi:hypothetical protein
MVFEFAINGITWRIYSIPPMVFHDILKEQDSHHKIYVLHERFHKGAVWICQSIPALCLAFQEMTGYYFFPSSIYRMIRNEAAFLKKGNARWICKKFFRNELDVFNEYLKDSEILHIVTKHEDRWIFPVQDDA